LDHKEKSSVLRDQGDLLIAPETCRNSFLMILDNLISKRHQFNITAD